MPSFPIYKQLDAMDCGPTCLRMIAKHYGKTFTLQTLRNKSYLSRDGVSMMGISEAAESIGFRTMGVSLTAEQLFTNAPLPIVVHWKQNHFVVVYKVSRDKVFVADPASLVSLCFDNTDRMGEKILSSRRRSSVMISPRPSISWLNGISMP